MKNLKINAACAALVLFCGHHASGESTCEIDNLYFPCVIDESGRRISEKALPLLPNIFEMFESHVVSRTSILDLDMRFRPSLLPSLRFPNFDVEDDNHLPLQDDNTKTTVYIPDPATAGLMPIENVFRGSDALRFWQFATSVGVSCSPSEYDPLFDVCSFVRERQATAETFIEHCSYYSLNGVAEAPKCEAVARLFPSLEVVAFRGIEWPQGGAGGDDFQFCILPNSELPDGVEIAKTLVEGLLGSQRKSEIISFGGKVIIQSEGINIDNFHPSLIVMLFFSATIEQNTAPPTYIEVLEFSGLDSSLLTSGPFVNFDYRTHFTVSPRYSDSIIEYREPNAGSELEISANISREAEAIISRMAPDFICNGSF